ncbi:MAG: HD family hydrolase [Nitrososphaeria archaeon]|nr:HD family hydrolase [Nitrososphaeria archaeon]
MSLESIAKVTRILKNIPRTGWLQNGIPFYEAESIAEHSFEVAVITLVLLNNIKMKVDAEKVLTMALIHDLSESVIGDMPKALTEKIGENLKHEIESKAFENVVGSRKLSEIFEEYSRGESLESKIVKFADKLSTFYQAKSYKNRGYDVDEIIEGTLEEIKIILKQFEEKEIVKMFNI